VEGSISLVAIRISINFCRVFLQLCMFSSRATTLSALRPCWSRSYRALSRCVLRT